MRRSFSRKYDLEAVFAYIKDTITATGYAPSDKQIGLRFKMPKATAAYHRGIMAARGWIQWRKHYPMIMKITRAQ